MINYKLAGSIPLASPVTISLETQTGGYVMVKMLDSSGYTWNVIRFNPDGTFTRIESANVIGLSLDSALRIQEHL